MPLVAGCWEIRVDGSRLLLQVWNSDKNLVRRVIAIDSETSGQLNLTIERFGKKPGLLQLLDKARQSANQKTKRSGRLAFRENFRRFLLRQFPGWRIAELSCEADLEHSLSPAYPRALLRKGSAGWAAIGAANAADADHALTFGLIWLDYLRRRDAKTTVEGLAIFVPEGSERATAQRIRHLDKTEASWALFVHANNWEQRVDPADSGNIDTTLPDRRSLPWVPEWVSALAQTPGTELVECSGEVSLRVRGLEFARWNGRDLRAGLEARRVVREGRSSEVTALAVELARVRGGSDGDLRSKLYSVAPERWLETQIREDPEAIDAGLLSSPIYGQAPTFAAGERGVIDLLAAGIDGRLTILEVKAVEDPHLPLQALDYWARVKWHLERGEFAAKGYFPGVPLSSQPPRMLLVAPALHFHPTTETILRYFSSEVQVERIGLAASWRSGLKVMFRATGDSPPKCEYKGEDNDEANADAATGERCTGAPESDGSSRRRATSVHDSAFCGYPAGL
ncbi:MAG: hypothetical protein H7Y20_06570 [Bryobacteraceae bacterium]|nr:hypothetical protein [Bryobacteraceae bacterium]